MREGVCTRSSSKNVTSTEYVTFILDSCENAVHEMGNKEREREIERGRERRRFETTVYKRFPRAM